VEICLSLNLGDRVGAKAVKIRPCGALNPSRREDSRSEVIRRFARPRIDMMSS
jgi:hypothetical protein